jgi:hypothetical protein
LKVEADKLAGDRLATTVFLAGLLHGMLVLGVTFGVAERDAAANPSLEVVILTDPDTVEAQPDSADYLAQAPEGLDRPVPVGRPSPARGDLGYRSSH